MTTPKDLFFDLHVHPSLKGGMSKDPQKYTAWRSIKIYEVRVIIIKLILFILFLTPILLYKNEYIKNSNLLKAIYGLILGICFLIKLIPKEFWIKSAIKALLLPTSKVRQLINSQANLTQISTHHHVAVVAFIAMEQGFAQSLVYRAIGVISPLDAKIMKKIRKAEITYLELFQQDINYLLSTDEIKVAKKFEDITPDGLNLILSVEGAHSFQGPDWSTIPANFSQFKKTYRFHHLTLAHLTQQPACVHSFGVRLKAGNFDTIKNSAFRPDSTQIGISSLGKDIIEIAYEDKVRPVLIDVKHMSFVSRLQFYDMRRKNEYWNTIPLLASHVSVTGTSFEKAEISKIRVGRKVTDCDEVFWIRKPFASESFFNPWTINLFDEDIIEIIKSSGLIGIIMDERVLGYGNLVGEYMSKKEVAFLELKKKIKNGNTTEPITAPDLSTLNINMTMNGIPVGLKKVKSTNDLKLVSNIFERWDENRKMKKAKVTHIHYVACNILHILKVGRKNNYDGINNKPNVEDCICIGSDLDGIIDAINFKGKRRSVPVNQHKWVTSDKYDLLKAELTRIMKMYIANDNYMRPLNINVDLFMDKLFYHNGLNFLKNNFK